MRSEESDVPMPMQPAREPEPRRRANADDVTERDGELALTMPDWDLLPPAEFLSRHREGH